MATTAVNNSKQRTALRADAERYTSFQKYTMRSISIMILAFSASFALDSTSAQSNPDPIKLAPNVVYVEYLGNGILPSINYERTVPGSPYRLRLGLSPLGLGGDGIGLSHSRFILVGSRYFRKGKEGLEYGLGVTASSDKVFGSYLLGTGIFGYRFEPAGGGIIFRIGWTPFVGRDGFLLGFGGLSLGYAF